MRKEVVVLLGVLTSVSVYADEPLRYSQSDFGGVGLLQMPTARMTPEGEFTFFMSHVSPYTRGGVVAQPYPWMEALFRYTNISNRLFGPEIAGDQDYKDKGFDLKLRLLEEGYHLPQVSVGFRDVGGTGLFSGEYLAASKQMGRFDFTLGVGWGYMANRGESIKSVNCII
ncbi:YjbH domain-containing protein [Marinobacterium jannaschii]|uniref:YjbH domain-containing protein n=1 Tax=Marinobacterium jannaschii TaxID=64970 RepID=UPI000685C706|nr:YjbH domain-containing protein [Marinobacterium jannaschii]